MSFKPEDETSKDEQDLMKEKNPSDFITSFFNAFSNTLQNLGMNVTPTKTENDPIKKESDDVMDTSNRKNPNNNTKTNNLNTKDLNTKNNMTYLKDNSFHVQTPLYNSNREENESKKLSQAVQEILKSDLNDKTELTPKKPR